MARWDENRVPNLDGKVAVVTGANSGLGLETAVMLARKGATVVLACRNEAKARVAAERVESAGAATPVFVALDLASLDSVAGAAKTIRERFDRLDILVNNAGLMMIDESRTEDGFEMQFGVNHLGHFALTAHLMPLIQETTEARIVNVSSMGHRPGRLALDDLMFERRRYDRFRPYFQSKLANLLFTYELSRRLTAAGSSTLALTAHPGASHTDLGHEGSGLANAALRLSSSMGQPARVGALSTVRAATDPSARSGQFYGPQFMMMGYPRLEKPSRRARNASDARKLWDKSEALTGVVFDI